MTLTKILLSLAVISNITAYILYLYSMYRQRIKPHAFTFLVWAILMSINFSVQLLSGVGEGSALLGTNLFFCLIIFIYCMKKGYTGFDSTDWLCLAFALIAIALWVITKTPLFSVILSCVIDVFAFIPSFRKSYKKPADDSALTFFISGLEYLLSFASYNVFSLIVLLYPILVLTLDFTYAGMILVRRIQLNSTK